MDLKLQKQNKKQSKATNLQDMYFYNKLKNDSKAYYLDYQKEYRQMNNDKYICDLCRFNCYTKQDFSWHIKTIKHNENVLMKQINK